MSFTRSAALAIVCVFIAAAAAAQARKPPQVKSYRLVLKEYKEVPKGKAAFLTGRAQPQGDRFFIEDMSILQPIAVSLKTAAGGDPVKLQLSKYRWDKADQEASTGADGVATLRVRTQGEVRIVVSGQGDKPYYLMVWAGDEVTPQLKPVVVRKASAAKPRSGGNYLKWAGIGAGVIAIAGVFFVMGRRKRS